MVKVRCYSSFVAEIDEDLDAAVRTIREAEEDAKAKVRQSVKVPQ